MRRLLLCANPAASGFTGGLHREVLARFRAGFDVEAEWPKTPDDTRRMSSEAAADGVDVVVAMGGDGVVHHVANGVGGSHSALGIIPAGTTNVLARLVGVPKRPRAAADLICEQSDPRAIPSARLTLTTASGTEHRRATFAAGMGLDAEVVEVAEQEPFRKYSFGGIHYARSAAGVLWSEIPGREPELQVSDGERTARAIAVLVQLHEQYTYFGRMPLKFGTYERGAATVLIVTELPRRRIASVFGSAAIGRDLNRIKGIEVWDSVTEVTISSSGVIPAQADGELLGTPGTLTVSADPDALHIIAAQPSPRSGRFRRSG